MRKNGVAMHFLLGWLFAREVSDGLGEINRNNGNALWGIVLWFLIPAIASWGAINNFGRDAGPPAGIATVVALLAFVCWRPSGSGFKMMMLSAIRFCAVFAGGLSFLVFAWKVGFPLLSGSFSEQGVSAFDLRSIGSSALYFFVAILVIGFLEFVCPDLSEADKD